LMHYGTDDQWNISPSGALTSILNTLGVESLKISSGARYVKGKKIKIGGDYCRGLGEYILVSHCDHVGVAG